MANGMVMVALPTWAALRAWLLHTVFGFLPFRSRLVSNWWFGKTTTRREQRAGYPPRVADSTMGTPIAQAASKAPPVDAGLPALPHDSSLVGKARGSCAKEGSGNCDSVVRDLFPSIGT